ncbi:MAG: hypothetical protein H6719_20045 [Sandaracinaceae bacterium]|nr:hypothetical protein [Sandaracinaceae bacterium]
MTRSRSLLALLFVAVVALPGCEGSNACGPERAPPASLGCETEPYYRGECPGQDRWLCGGMLCDATGACTPFDAGVASDGG